MAFPQVIVFAFEVAQSDHFMPVERPRASLNEAKNGRWSASFPLVF